MGVLSSDWCNLIAVQASQVSTVTIGARVVAVGAYDGGLYLVLLLCSKFRRLVSDLSHRSTCAILYSISDLFIFSLPENVGQCVESNIMILE